MKKVLFISLMLLSIQANAGLLLGAVLGYAAGSSGSSHNNGTCVVELKPDELVCETNNRMDYCIGQGYGGIGDYVKRKGFNFYHKQAICYTGDTRIMVLKVWK